MTKDEMKQAFREAVSAEYDNMPAGPGPEEIEIRPAFEERMQRLFRRTRNPLWYLINTPAKKAAWAFAAVLAVISLTFLPAKQQKSFYEISALPDGYREDSRVLEGSFMKIACSNPEHDYLTFEQVYPENTDEYRRIADQLPADQTVRFIQRGNSSFLIWVQDDAAFSMEAYGTLSSEEFLLVAASVRKTD